MMEVKVLGSVSPYCNATKNGPGFLITSKDTKILLDCGPGASRLLNMQNDLQNMTIVLSHLHYDHFSDIISSISYASYVYHNLGLLDKKVQLFIPAPDYYPEYDDYTNEYNQKDYKLVEQPEISYQLLNKLGPESYIEIKKYQENSAIKIDNITITFANNPHNIRAYSIKVTDGETTIVYSGDTGYLYNSLEKFAIGSNLLICESTFLKGQSKGQKDFHLYAHEAAKIATSAQPDLLMLTHFWPEIDKQKYVDEATTIFPNTIAAEEGMVLKLNKNHIN